jgi:hypothetical protein
VFIDDIVSPFFVVEWKAWRGNLLDAKVQARRAGAAVVWGRRRARDAIKVAGAVIGMHTGAGARVIEDVLWIWMRRELRKASSRELALPEFSQPVLTRAMTNIPIPISMPSPSPVLYHLISSSCMC